MHLYTARFLLPIDRPPIEDGALLVENGLIRAVGSRQQLAAAHPGAAVVDFGDAVVLPPMANAHTHLELTAYPEWAGPLGGAAAPGSFVDWILQLVRVRRSVSPGQVKISLAAGLDACLAAGTGVVGDILTSLDAANAYAASPLRGTVFCEVLGLDRKMIAQRLDSINVMIASDCSKGLAWGVSPHAPYTLDEATARQVSRFAKSRALPLAMHIAETLDEVDFLQDGGGPIAERLYAEAGWSLPARQDGGLRPVDWADRQEWLLPGSLVVHGVHVNADEIRRLARQRCSVVLCPRSNSAFGAARAPLAGYRSAGVNLALGTDSLASSPSLSVWDELAFAQDWFAGALSAADWLAVATLGGARALGLDGKLGSLTPAKEASFQVLPAPAGIGLAGLEENLCTCGHPDIKALYLSGNRVWQATGPAVA